MARLRTVPVYTVLALLGIVLMSTPCVAQISLDVKGGVQTLENPLTLEKTTRPRYEVEIAGMAFDSENVEFSLAFGGASVSSVTSTHTDYDDIGMIQDTLEDNFRTYDVRLGLRLYPISPEKYNIHPYVGGGVGYYWMVDEWKDTHLETVNSPYSEYVEEEKGRRSLAKGFFPYITAGVDIPVSDQVALLFEYKHDFMKKKDGANYGGDMFTAGLRFRW